MRTREDADLDGKRTDVLRAPPVRAEVLLGDGLAELLLQDLLEDRGDLFQRECRALAGGELRDRLEFQIVEARFTLSLVGVAKLGVQPLAQERRHRAEAARFGDDRDVFQLRLARRALEVGLRVADLANALLRQGERLDEEFLGDLPRAGFHHHDRVARAGDDEVEVALQHLLDRRVQGELTVHRADPNTADRPFERSVREAERGRRRVHGEDVVIVFLVGRPRGHDDLHVVAEALRP